MCPLSTMRMVMSQLLWPSGQPSTVTDSQPSNWVLSWYVRNSCGGAIGAWFKNSWHCNSQFSKLLTHRNLPRKLDETCKREGIDRRMKSSSCWALSHCSLINPGDWIGTTGEVEVCIPTFQGEYRDQLCQMLLIGQVIWDWDLTIGLSVEVVGDLNKLLNGVGLEYVSEEMNWKQWI